MLGSSKLVRIIFIACFVVLITLNLWFWITPRGIWATAGNDASTIDNIQHFKGFSWFFDRIGEFPGWNGLIEDMTSWMKNIPPNWDNGIIGETTLSVIKGMITPVMLIYYILKNVALTIWWIFKFLGLAIFS